MIIDVRQAIVRRITGAARRHLKDAGLMPDRENGEKDATGFGCVLRFCWFYSWHSFCLAWGGVRLRPFAIKAR